MQPCPVCGGMAVDHNGYCTQCGTYRGQVTQPPPASAPPWPGPAGGAPVPASGAPWPGQASGAPYPYSGPPVSAPVPPQRRPMVGLLIAGCVVAVLLIGAIVVVALTRSSGKPGGDGTPSADRSSAAPGPSATIDACLVGTWKATSERQQQDYPGVGPVTLTGSGEISHVHADGTVNDDYSQATPYTGAYDGHTITMTVKGTVDSHITTSTGTLTFHDQHANGTVALKLDGADVGSPVPLSVSADPVQYTCGSTTATEHTDHYDVTMTRVSGSP